MRQALTTLWEASDRLCGKRLRPLLPALVDALERHGHLMLDDSLRKRLLAASPATIDRLLHAARATTSAERRARGKPALRRSVPVRTFADWNDPPPGNMEIDLVAHCGGTVAGSFVHTLVLTDIATGWTECLPLVVREATLVVDGIERVRSRLPFQLLGLDSDNGSEFINESMVHYCTSRGIEFTRSRPYRKNDQAWVEQKNGAVVRRLVGYHRLQGIAGAEALSRLYAASRLFVNFFQPSFKLASKTRIGARVRKHYHAPQTPCARLLACDSVSEHAKHRLQEIAQQLDPLRLLDEIRAMQHHVVALAAGEKLHLPPRRDDELAGFLASLTTAWRAGETRPTHAPKQRPERYWRTRKDPFESVWGMICEWLEVEPEQTALQLLERLQHAAPGDYPDALLRTLQRRLKEWRTAAARRLVFGPAGTTDCTREPREAGIHATKETIQAGAIYGEAQGSVSS